MGYGAVMVREDRAVVTAGKVGLAVLAVTATVVLLPPMVLAAVVAGKVALVALSVVLALAVGGVLLKATLFVALPAAVLVYLLTRGGSRATVR